MSKKRIEAVSSEDISLAKKALVSFGDGKVGRDLYHMLASRYRVLYIQSHEEDRVTDCFKQMSIIKGYNLFRWDCSRGLCDVHTGDKINDKDNELHTDPGAVLSYIVDKATSDNEKMANKTPVGSGSVFFLLDFHPFLDNLPPIERKLKEFSKIQSMCFIVIISPVFHCPSTLEKVMTLVDFPMPSTDEIAIKLEQIITDVKDRYPLAEEDAKDRKEDIIKAAKGLTLEEVGNAYARSLVKCKKFDVPTILDEKKQIIRKSGILEYLDPKFTFDNIGGLENLKEWLLLRRLAFREDASAFGLPAPKGVLLIGVPGTGKSLTAEALASYYEMPLLRLDMGAVFGSHVGESEANVRMTINTADAVAPAILWIDEVEKGLGGVQSSNFTDGGVTNRVFGTLLTWLQEKESPVFVIATANNVLSLPPEFMRAGRFDEIFFLDLPNKAQRCEIIEKLLLRKKRDPKKFDIEKISNSCENYSPVEIEKAINNGLFIAYSEERRELVDDDVIDEMGKFQPLFNSRREDIEEMRRWALGEGGEGGRARLANETKKAKSAKVVPEFKKFDLGEGDL
jgi:ATP-dependent 26S proteasome regulatory subunit